MKSVYYVSRLLFLTNDVIKPVSAEELGRRGGKVINEIKKLIDMGLLPLAGIVLLFSIIMFIVGGLSKNSAVKKMGVYGFFVDCLGVFLYFTIPLILGFIKYLSNIANKG